MSKPLRSQGTKGRWGSVDTGTDSVLLPNSSVGRGSRCEHGHVVRGQANVGRKDEKRL